MILWFLFWLALCAYALYHFRRPILGKIMDVWHNAQPEIEPWTRGFADFFRSIWKAEWQECPYGYPKEYTWDKGHGCAQIVVALTLLISAMVFIIGTLAVILS